MAAFATLLCTLKDSGSTAPKPTPLDTFLDSHPVAKTFLTTQKPAPESYATLTYYGGNAFGFIGGSGHEAAVCYRFVPKAGEHVLDAAALKAKGPNYLGEEIRARVGVARRRRHQPIGRLVWRPQTGETRHALDHEDGGRGVGRDPQPGR